MMTAMMKAVIQQNHSNLVIRPVEVIEGRVRQSTSGL
jgi:hypothetical protein